MTPRPAPPAESPETVIVDAESARMLAALHRARIDALTGVNAAAEAKVRGEFADVLAVAARWLTFAELAQATGNETSYLQREAAKSRLYQRGRKDTPG